MKEYFDLKKLILFGWLMIFLSFGGLTGSSLQKSHGDKHLEEKYVQLQKDLSRGNFHKVISDGKALIQQRHFSFVKIYPLMAQAAKQASSLDSLIGYFQELIKSNPENPYFPYALGTLYVMQIKRDQGLENFSRACTLKPDFSEAFIAKGKTYLELNRYVKARKDLHTAMKWAIKLNRPKIRLECLNLLGNSFFYQSNYDRALSFYKEVYTVARQLQDKKIQAYASANIGLVATRLSNYPEALESCHRGLKISHELGLKDLQGTLFTFIGIIYYDLGLYEKALHFYNKKLKITPTTGKDFNWYGVYNEIGLAYFGLKNHQKAKENFEIGLKHSRRIKNRWLEGIVLGNLALVYDQMKDYRAAIEFSDKSLQISRQIGYKRDQGYVLNFQGNLNLKLGKLEEASKRYDRALVLGRKINIQEIIWNAYSGKASCLEKQQKYQGAIKYYIKAVEVIEGVRGILRSNEQKSAFLQDKINIYESLINLLVKLNKKHPNQGYDEQAFFYLEKSKARSFLDSLTESNVNLNSQVPQELLKRAGKIQKEIQTIQTQLMDNSLPSVRRADLLKKLTQNEENYDLVREQISYKNPDYANLVFPIPRKLKKIQQKLLNEKTAMLEYLIGDLHSFVFLITSKDLVITRLPDNESLKERIKSYIRLFQYPGKNKFRGTAAAVRVYQDLLAPLEKRLNTFRHLIIIPDGHLHYLPFETLMAPSQEKKFLINDFEISYAPSASVLANILDRKSSRPSRRDLLAFANPNYKLLKRPINAADHSETSENYYRNYFLDRGFHLTPLKYSEKEVRDIAKLFKKGSAVLYFRENAKEERLKKMSLKDFKIIHFATHGLLDEKITGRSALVLTLDDDPVEDGFFQVREIYNIKLNADMVVLSACQTGKGELRKGEGVAGLARSFLYAGADSVLVTLWNIHDESTSHLIHYFYQYLARGNTRARALRLAKLKMQQTGYSHPFYWAPFLLIGNHKGSLNLQLSSMDAD